MSSATQELSVRIVELAHARRRFGYRRIHDLLAREGHEVNHKRVWRLYKMNELSVRKRRKARRMNLERVPLTASRHVNDTWSADFVMDALANGRRIKCLTIAAAPTLLPVRRSGVGPLPAVRQQLVDAVVRMARQPLEHVAASSLGRVAPHAPRTRRRTRPARAAGDAIRRSETRCDDEQALAQ